MLAIKSSFNIVTYIYLIDYLVCILLQGSSKNDDFVILSHRLNKLYAPWSNKEIAFGTELKIINEILYLLQHYESKSHLDLILNNTFCLLELGQGKVEKPLANSKSCSGKWLLKHLRLHLLSELQRGFYLLGSSVPVCQIYLFVLIQMCLCCQQI